MFCGFGERVCVRVCVLAWRVDLRDCVWFMFVDLWSCLCLCVDMFVLGLCVSGLSV